MVTTKRSASRARRRPSDGRRNIRAIAVLAGVALIAAGCGDDDDVNDAGPDDTSTTVAATAAATTTTAPTATGTTTPPDGGDADPADDTTTTDIEPVTLRMAHPFAPLPTIDHLQAAVAELSGGDLRIDVVEFPPTVDEEQQIVAAVAAGDIDLGWVGTRAFAEIGVTSFDALTAPLLVDSYPLQQAVLDSEIPDRMLAGVEPLGVDGLAVIGGGLRKPIAVDGPLLGPDDYDDGITWHTFHAEGNARTAAALGAAHTDGELRVGLIDGSIQGTENTLLWYAQGGYVGQAPYVTLNVNLWPQTAALVTNPEVMAGLSNAQADWLHEAVADTVALSVELSDVDADLLEDVCSAGGRFAEASDADLEALRQAVEPVYAQISEDADTSAFLAEIEALKETVTDEPLTIPDGCTGEAPTDEPAADATDDPSLLNGTYRYEWTIDELVDLDVATDVIANLGLAGVFTWTFDDGIWELEQPDGPCDGTYAVRGDTVDIVWDPPCTPFEFTATWELTDTGVVMSDTLLDGQPNAVLDAWLAGKPWERVE